MGPQIKNRKVRIVIYFLIITLMAGHLAFGTGNKMFHFLDITIVLLACIRLWLEFHEDN